MKKFYVRGIAHTTRGLFTFQDRNLKNIKKKLKRQKIKYVLLYEKIKGTGKRPWIKSCITMEELDANKF